MINSRDIKDLIAGLKLVVSAGAEKRAAIFHNVVDKNFYALSETHKLFIDLSHFTRKNIEEIYAVPTEKKLDHLKKVKGLADKLRDELSKHAPERRRLYEEARYILSDEQAFVTGVIKGLDSRQEVAVRAFLTDFISYFQQSEIPYYNHDLRALLDRIYFAIEHAKTIENTKRENNQNANVDLKNRIHKVVVSMATMEGIISEKWARVARSYAEARFKLVPPGAVSAIHPASPLMAGSARNSQIQTEPRRQKVSDSGPKSDN